MVILMQENRAFDHYFGTPARRARLRRSPAHRPAERQAGLAPAARDQASPRPSAPSTWTPTATRAESMASLDHSWKGSHAWWKHHDAWIPAKAPADHGLLHPRRHPVLLRAGRRLHGLRRLPLLDLRPDQSRTGCSCSPAPAGWPPATGSQIVVTNPPDDEQLDRRPAPRRQGLRGLRLAHLRRAAAGGGRLLAGLPGVRQLRRQRPGLFRRFRGIGPTRRSISEAAPGSAGSTRENAKTSKGEHLVAEFAKDVAADRLPQVSWIVPSYRLCEHPSRHPRRRAPSTAAHDRGAGRQPEGLGQDRLHPELRRERRLLRPCAAADPGPRRGARARAPSPRTGEDLSRRAGGPGPAGADDRRLALDARAATSIPSSSTTPR